VAYVDLVQDTASGEHLWAR